MAGNAGYGHVCHRGAMKCHGVLTECRSEGMLVVCGFVGIGSSSYAAAGAWDSVQSTDAPCSKSRDGTVPSTGRVALNP